MPLSQVFRLFPHSGDRILDRLLRLIVRRWGRVIAEELLKQYVVFGPRARFHLAPTAIVNNAVFNTASGQITIGDWVMIAHGAYLATGRHDVSKFGAERQSAVPCRGMDIIIDEGAWLATNVTVLGPCRIGKHAVVAAGSLVRSDVSAYAVVAGVPARQVAFIPRD